MDQAKSSPAPQGARIRRLPFSTALILGAFALTSLFTHSIAQDSRSNELSALTALLVPETQAEVMLVNDNRHSFTKNLTMEEFTFSIQAGRITGNNGAPDDKYTIQTSRGGQSLGEIQGKVPAGEMLDAVTADVNGNGSPELWLLSVDLPRGAQGKMFGYEFTANGWEEFAVPTPEGELSQGYRGQDVYGLTGDLVIHMFPVYNEGDAPEEPSGGIRFIVYSMDENRVFTIAETGIEQRDPTLGRAGGPNML